jgi:TonB family protein
MFTLTRTQGDSAAGYRLTGTNGAWLFAVTVAPSQIGAFLGALRGDTASGALAYEYPRMGKTRDTDAPDVSGAWLGNQVDREARPGPRVPRPTYPFALRGSGIAGTVRLLFTVDSTGRVPPASVRLIRTPHPMLAIAARDAVVSARYTPAERDGRPVAQITMQDFVFEAQ